MKRLIAALMCGTFALTAGVALGDVKGGKIDGKKEFAEHCAACHKDGGNIINPAKTLKKSDREMNGVKSANDIVKLMRNPGPGMSKFDKKDISDKEAKAIADYIMKTF
jgi:cytochrome c6